MCEIGLGPHQVFRFLIRALIALTIFKLIVGHKLNQGEMFISAIYLIDTFIYKARYILDMTIFKDNLVFQMMLVS